MLRAAMTPAAFAVFAQSIARLLRRFIQKSESAVFSDFARFQFPRLFPQGSTCARRFHSQCLIGAGEIEAIEEIVGSLAAALPLLDGTAQGPQVADLAALLLVLRQLQPEIDASVFVEFVSRRFPYAETAVKHNVIIAKFLLNEPPCHSAIRQFLRDVELSPDTIVLFATLGGFEALEVPAVSECVQELCEAQISDEAVPAIANTLLNDLLNEEKPTKRCLRMLISLRKSEDFLENLFGLLSAKLVRVPPAVRDLLLVLVTSSALLTRPFLRRFALFIASEVMDDDIAAKCVEAVTMTVGVSDDSCLISFLMTIGTRRLSVRNFAKRQLKRMKLVVDPVSRELFCHLNLDTWTVT
jgi:hypothetical protein